MLIVMERDCSGEQIKKLLEVIEEMGLAAHPIAGMDRTVLAVTGSGTPLDAAEFECHPGVSAAIPITRAYMEAGREACPAGTLVTVGPVTIGGAGFVIVAGPCAVESERQMIDAARAVRDAGAHILRGGAWKPRTSPYSFQGLGREGLRILAKARQETGLPVVTEAVDVESVGWIEDCADMIQIGARNMQNFQLLKRAGRASKPVFLKRGLSATLDEWLLAAEYLLSEGNRQVVLCERGVRTFASHARNTLDLSVVPALKERSHLPVLVDPSHGTGSRAMVPPLSRAALAVGADGLMVEVHPRPEKALSDGAQALRPAAFRDLVRELARMAPILGRTLDNPGISARADGSAARA